MKGSIVKKNVAGKNRYYVVVDLPHPKGAKRKQKWFPVGTSYRAAENALPQILLEVKSKNYLSSQTVQFKNIAEDYLFNNQNRLAASTYKRYAGITKDLIEHFGDYTMQELEPYHMEQYTKSLIQKGLSGNTITKYRLVYHLICEYAQELKIIKSIPLAKLKHGGNREDYTFQVWDNAEATAFLQHIEGSPLYMPVFIAIHTGMRLGEILALKWSEIDLKNGQLTVRYSVDVNGKLKTTKTKQSRRTIKLIPSMIARLKEHKHDQKLNRLAMGNDYFKSDFVCTFQDGRPISRNYVSTTFRRKVHQYQFPVIRFHDLRHSFATIALSNNVHVKVVQEILGHASSRTTLDVYSHVIPTMQTQSLELLTKAFGN